jgi:hypothetical protein
MAASFLAIWVWENEKNYNPAPFKLATLKYEENSVMSTLMLSWLWSFTVIGFKNENIFCFFACLFGLLQRRMGANLALL